MVKSLVRDVIRQALKPMRVRKLQQLVSDGFPTTAVPALRFLIDDVADPEASRVADAAEKVRAQTAARGKASVEILYSPKPGTSGAEATPDLRPQHGEEMQFTMEQVARTGKDRRWGIALHLLARASRAKVMLELGSCAGISGSYLAASPYCEILHTVEGSAALAALAQENLDKTTSRAHVHNALFDDALDRLLPALDHIDLAFIDGHHEKVATIHYWQRIAPKLRPGSLVIFDDVSWSQDMRDGWDFLCKQTGFSHAIDFGAVGVCTWEGGNVRPRCWNLQPIVGRARIGIPHGWRSEAA